MATKKITNRAKKLQIPVNRNLEDEFVVADGLSIANKRTLSLSDDELEIELDPKIYDMMETDSTIYKGKKILITQVLSDDLQLAPGANEELVSSEEYALYKFFMDYIDRVNKGLDSPLRNTLEQLYDNSLSYGHGIAEIEWEQREDVPDEPNEEDKEDKARDKSSGSSLLWQLKAWVVGTPEMADTTKDSADPLASRPQLKGPASRLMPRSFKVKARGQVRFVVDDYMNVLGYVPARKDYKQLKFDEILDPDKFWPLTMNKKNEDPRGRSHLRAAFNWYNLKRQIPAEMLRYILEESVPKAVGTMPPQDQQPFEVERDADGNIVYEDEAKTQPKMITVAESFMRLIENFRSGAGAVIPDGSKLEPYRRGLTGSTDGHLFARIIKTVNTEMEDAILLQTLAQSEGEHQARSASEQVAQVLHNLVFWHRWLIAVSLIEHVYVPAIRLNFGDWALKYMPLVSLGDYVRRDWVAELAAVADAYFKGFLDDSQRAELMAWLNLPRPGKSRQEMNNEMQASQDVNGEAAPLNKNRPDKQGGTKDRNAGNGTEKKNGNTNGVSVGYGMGHDRGRFGRALRFIQR